MNISLKSISVFAFALAILLGISSNSNATAYYTAANGTPGTLANWWTATNGTGTHPANFTTSGDVFTIQTGHTMTTTGNWTVTGTVQINNGGNLAVTSSGTTMNFGALTINSGGSVIENRPLTVNGATNISGTITFGSTSTKARAMIFTGDVILNSGAVWSVPALYSNGTTVNANTFAFAGNFTNNAISFNDLGTGAHTFSGASKTINGTTITSIGSVAVTGTPTNTGTLTIRTALTGAGNLTNGNGTNAILNLGGSATITTLTAIAANNFVNYTGAAQTAKVTTYNNLTLSGSLAKTFATTPTVNGILSMEGTATIAITTGVVTYGTNATLQYNTSTARTASSEEWITPFVGTGGIIIKNTGAITTPGAVQIGNNTSILLNINSGATLTPGVNLLTFHGDFINAGTLTSGSGGITIAGTVATQSIAGFTTTGTVTLTKTAGTATMQGNINGGALTINGSGGTLNLGTALTHTFTGNVTLTAGTLNGGSSILNETTVSTTAWNGTGTVFSAGAGTVNFNAAGAQTLSATATTFNNLTISNSGLKTFSNTPTVNGVLSMEGSATVSAAPTYGSNARLQFNTASSRTAGTEWITPFVASGGVVIANTGTITMNAAKVFNSTAPLTVNNGSSLAMSTFLLTLNGNFINNGGTASGTTGGVTLTGTATQSIGALTTTGTLMMTKTGGVATFTGNLNGAGLTINGSGGALNLGVALTHTFTGVITLTTGSLNGGSSTLNENNISATAWNGTGSVFTAADGTVNLGAAGNQTIVANSIFNDLAFSGSGNKTFSNITTINGDLSISGTAIANLGAFTTHTSNSLTLGGVSQVGGSWGSTSSSASNKNNTYFLSSATGMLNVNCDAPAAPVSGGNQTICAGATIPALSVTVNSGETAYWYTQASGGTLLASATLTYTQAAPGTYYAGARTIAGGCASATRTGVTLFANALPTLLSLTGSTICASPGNNGTIASTTSQIGVNYQLYNSVNSPLQSAISGTGSPLSWTGLSIGSGYYVVGTNAATSCASSNSNAVNVSAYTTPTALILTGSTICSSPGGDGTIFSSTSVTGINYQLYDGSNAPVQGTQTGTGTALVWLNLNAGAGYYVISSSATTSCVSANSNTVAVSPVANPADLALTGSTICTSPGTNGTITSTTSESGVTYQLFDNTDTEVGTPVTGTGTGLTWSGLTAGTGLYVVGTNSSSFCTSAGNNAVNISTSANPSITSSATAGSTCFSTSAQNTTLTYSSTTNSPTHYFITWNSVAHTAGLVDLSATPIIASPLNVPIAANVAGGTYTGTLYVSVSSGGCSSLGNAFTVTINTAPAAPIGSTSQIFCNGSTVANLSATGTSIAWYNAASGGSLLSGATALVNGTHYYASQTVSGCPSSSRLDVTASVITSGSWIGATSTDWFTTSNWCGGVIPTASTDVILASGLQRYPSIGASGAVCNNITIASGTSLTIVGTNTLTVSGSWTNNGIFIANSSTLVFNGAIAANIGTSNFYNITLGGAGIKTATGALSVGGSVSITNNFTSGAFTHTISGSWTNSGSFVATGSTIDFNGSGSASVGTSNFNNITFSGAGTKIATGALTIAGNVSITGNFTAGAFTHAVGGNWTKTGIFTAIGSTINFNGAGAGNIGASNFNNVTFSGAGTKTATGALSIIGSLTITGNFNAGSYIHNLQGDWTNNGTFTANTSTFTFYAATPQNIAGSAATTFNNFIQSGTGLITLGVATSVSGTLTLTLGLIDIGNFNFTITPTGSISGGSATSYVKTSGTGRLKETVPGIGGSKIYPIGNSSYNPMTVQYNDINTSKNFSIRVADGAITNANSAKTVNRKWYLSGDIAGSSNLTLTASYNSGEEGTGFSNSSSPQIGYFDGSSWIYRPITSGSGTTTFIASGSAPDFTNTSGFFALGSGDAFRASKLVITNISPSNPSVGLASTAITVQSQNSNGIPTEVTAATGFDLSCTNTTMSTTPTGTIGQYTYETTVPSITFTLSTYNTGTSTYNHNATVTATQTSGESLTAGTSAVFDVYDGAIYEPVATENWNATNGWRKSTDGGSTWTNPATLPTSNIFADNDLIRIPVGITLTANVTGSFYSMLVYGTLDISASGNLTINHSSYSDYNIHVHGTLKNSGGTLVNSNASYPLELIEIHGGTYWHNMDGGSIPVCTFSSLGSTLSTCKVQGTGVAGLNQIFENFTLVSGSQVLAGDMTVNGALTLTTGKITAGSYHVIVGLNGTASNSGAGYVNGVLRRYVSNTTTSGDFPVGDSNYYAPFSLLVTGTPSGNGYIDVSTTAAQPSTASGLSQTKYINRKWSISNNGVAGVTIYSPGCTFVDADKVGSPATGSLKLRKFTVNTWYTTNGTTTGNTITATGLSTAGLYASSDFYVGEDDCSSTNAVWLGSTSTDWNTATNWCSGAVPTSATDVTIPSSPTMQPVIGSAGGACKNITIQSGASLTISGAYTLDLKADWTNSGTFNAGTGTVTFTGTSAQTITGATTFSNLTINNATGVTSANDITVNGLLTLTSANPDATHGSLSMGIHTLSMLTASASVAGTGDVSGIVRRHHTFIPNTQYQFGNQFTSLNFLNTGTQPDEVSCRISIGAAPAWKTGAIQRFYSFAQTGTAGTDQVTLNLSYLTSELNSNDETKLVLWDHHYTGGDTDEHGKSNNSTSNHWVGLSGRTITYVAPTTIGNKEWGLANYSAIKNTWAGAYSNDWRDGTNWTGGHAPLTTEDVLIPNVSSGSNRYPVLTSTVEIKTLEIASGATLTAGTYGLTINGYNDAWQNNGTFVPGTGTVSITHGILTDIVSISGTTQFYNITIAANTFVRLSTGSLIKISGLVNGDVSSIVDLSVLNNTVEYNGTDQYIVNPSTTGFAGRGYYNLVISGTGAYLVDDLDISGNFISNGTLDTGSGTVSFIGTTAQTISGTTTPVFNNLTINNSAGVSSSTDLTVNGILYLESDNPSLVAGTLVMNTGKVLNMGNIATTTGTGDVTGIIKRTNTFITNTFYAFGNINQGFLFPVVSGQIFPTSVTVRVSIGSAPVWGTAGVNNPVNVTRRTYEMEHDGGSGTKAIFRINYKDNELASGVNESSLSIWSYYVPGSIRADEGWSYYDANANYIAISDIDFTNIPSGTLGDFQVAIAPTSSDFKTWNGSSSTDWNTPSNWTPNGVPTTGYGVIIPDANTTVYQPLLPASGSTQATCQYLIIETDGVLNSGSGDNATLTIVDGVVGDAWGCEAGGTFNAGNSTVVFAVGGTDAASISGRTDFYNVTVTGATGSKLRPGAGCYMSIAGALNISAGYLGAATNENTIEFKGNGTQVIPNPNGSTPGYHNLILSGSGTKTFPATLNIADELTNNATGTVDNNSGTVIFDGNAYGQAISGITPTIFNNLTLNNSDGLLLNGVNAEVDGTLTFTSGKITTHENILAIGSAGAVSGAGAGKYVFGRLQKGIAASTTSKTFETGNISNYLPITIDFAGTATNGTGNITCSTTDGQQPEYATSGLSQAKYLNRYWTVSNSGVTFGTYDATFTFINPDDTVGSANLSALLIKEYSAASWSSTTTGTLSSTTVKTTGNTTFGDFVAGEALSGPTDYFRSKATGNWSSPSTWESSANGTTWNPSSLVPDNNAHQITISGGTIVTIDATATASNLYIAGTLTSGSGIELSINGIWENLGAFIEGTGTITFNGTSAQTISGPNTFNNLTIGNAAGVTAFADQTVNGILNLSSINASSTKGSLYMGHIPDPEYVLHMGASATTTGIGDVSGYINRSSFVLDTDYTFGNRFTLMNFTVGPLPSSVTLEVYLTSSDINWKTEAIHRFYDVTRTGGSAATRLRFNIHYLDSELNGATEENLDLFDYHVSADDVHDHGRTDLNTTNNWVGFGNVGLAFLGTASADDHFWTLGTSTTNDVSTWIGGSPSGPTDWDLPGNWEGGTPRIASHVIIPGSLTYYPVLPDAAMPDGSLSGGRIIGMLEIQPGGVLNATIGTPILTINGAAGAWINTGTFNAGSGTIVFTNATATIDGVTNFNNIMVVNGAGLTPVSGNIVRIAGTLSLSSSGILDAGVNPNTVEYNGAAQTVVVPNPSTNNYADLILSGSGIKTMPPTALGILGDFIMAGAATTTLTATLTVSDTTKLSDTTILTLGATDILSNAGSIALDGGTFKTGATTGYSETVGVLILLDNSTISLGTGTHSLAFSASDGVSWTPGKMLTISGWTGAYNGTGGTAGKIYIGSATSGLTAAQLAEISFYNGSTYYAATILSTGEVVPIENAISTETITGSPFCAGSSGISVPFTYSLASNFPSATFTAELSSSSGSFTTFVTLQNVASNSSGSQSISVTIPSNTTYGAGYRIRIVSDTPATTGSDNGNDLIVNSAGTWIGGTSTGWNTDSNWCGGVPNSGTNVTVPSGTDYSPNVDITNAVCNDLIINSGAVLTINAGKALSVAGSLTNSAGISGLVLESNTAGTASLIQNSNNVTATVQRYISGNAEDWHFLSSPVAAQAISGS